MRGHRTYIVECKSTKCDGRYEMLVQTEINAASVKAVGCPKCEGAVKLECLGVEGPWGVRKRRFERMEAKAAGWGR